MLQTEFECFKGGDGPDFHIREQKERVEQMLGARAYADEISKERENISQKLNSCRNASESFTPTNSSHWPDKEKLF